MLFTSGLFLFAFLPVALVLYYGLARTVGASAAAAALAFMSFFFYGYWAPAYLPLLIGSIALNFFGGLLIGRTSDRSRAKLITTSFIALDLILLGYFKYYNFFADALRSAALPIPILNVTLPIGISFFTFTQIAFLVDTYQGKVKEFRPVPYALFVTYFPHLIAGPILHHSEMMPQFADQENYRPSLKLFALGAAFLVIGLVKKVLIADSVSGISDVAFAVAPAGGLTVLRAWEGLIAYAMQIYFDFSGYSDMAVGISLLFGIRLPYNFNSPYKSLSIVDFWRRWHMTLSRFLRDYLYIALGGNRRGPVRRYLNLFLTMLLGGLWHGAAWTFVIWGALHGTYLIINHGWLRLTKGKGFGSSAPGRFIAWTLTMAAVLLAWTFFRAASVSEAIAVLSSAVGASAHQPDLLANTPMHWPVLVALIAIVALLPNTQTIVMGRLEATINTSCARSGVLVSASLGLAVVALVVLALIAASRSNSAFIYFNF